MAITNDTHVGSTTSLSASPDGKWSLRLERDAALLSETQTDLQSSKTFGRTIMPPVKIERAEYEAWRDEHHNELMKALYASTDMSVVMLRNLLPGKIEAVWESGSWLKTKLMDLGCSHRMSSNVCFAHGQRCQVADPVEVALEYVNEYASTGDVVDRPGPALAERIFQESVKRN